MNIPAEAQLTDGTVVHLRPIHPSDHDRHERFVEALSDESRYLRFMSPRPHLTSDEIDHFCAVDHIDREAVVATIGDDIVGVGRYDRTDRDSAEVAFAVADPLQGHGLGTLLLETLADTAREHGITHFTAEMFASNFRMAQVFRDAGFVTSSHHETGGEVHVELDLRPTAELRDAVAARHRPPPEGTEDPGAAASEHP